MHKSKHLIHPWNFSLWLFGCFFCFQKKIFFLLFFLLEGNSNRFSFFGRGRELYIHNFLAFSLQVFGWGGEREGSEQHPPSLHPPHPPKKRSERNGRNGQNGSRDRCSDIDIPPTISPPQSTSTTTTQKKWVVQ